MDSVKTRAFEDIVDKLKRVDRMRDYCYKLIMDELEDAVDRDAEPLLLRNME